MSDKSRFGPRVEPLTIRDHLGSELRAARYARRAAWRDEARGLKEDAAWWWGAFRRAMASAKLNGRRILGGAM